MLWVLVMFKIGFPLVSNDSRGDFFLGIGDWSEEFSKQIPREHRLWPWLNPYIMFLKFELF